MAATDFWSRVERTRGCWIWRGPVMNRGYGKCCRDGESLAHRVAYRLAMGPIPLGLELDHLCRNPLCVNPAHLQPVTPLENFRRGFSPQAICARQTHCVNGHPINNENTYRHGGRRRQCRICQREAVRRYQQRRRAA